MTLKKWLIALISTGLILLVGSLLVVHQQSTTTAPTATSASRPRHQPTPPLTLTELEKNPKLTYSCVVYYAIKHTRLQRWQEVNDFQAGWQIEHFAKKHPTRYLVWPDKNISSAEKNLAPNWFTLSKGKVTYDSMIVHSFRKDQTATTTLNKIVARINADHAMKKVRHMPTKMTVLNHQ